MQINIKCPACNTESGFFIAKNVFQGPFKCRECKAFFTIKVTNGELQLCEPLSQEDFDKQKAAKKAKKKER
ncbi:hypothetical protein ACFLVW_06670 [Chloroflexota bacterium]